MERSVCIGAMRRAWERAQKVDNEDANIDESMKGAVGIGGLELFALLLRAFGDDAE